MTSARASLGHVGLMAGLQVGQAYYGVFYHLGFPEFRVPGHPTSISEVGINSLLTQTNQCCALL